MSNDDLPEIFFDGEESSPEDILTIDMLAQHAYCPRRLHLMYVDGRWDDNVYTLDGTSVHRRVDASEDLLPDVAEKTGDPEQGDPPPTLSRSVTLTDEKLGLTGKLDLVETEAGHAIPVETKRGAPPNNPLQSWEPQRVQLMAQTLLLRAHGYHVETGIIYFAGTRRRVEIPMDSGLEFLTKEHLRQTRRVLRLRDSPPPLDDSPKCNGCSLAGICLPDETNLLRKAVTNPILNDLVENPAETLPDPRRLYPVRDDAVPLYLNEQGAQVGKNGDSITVKKVGEKLGQFPLKDISQVILLGNISITAPAIALLAEHDIPIAHHSRGWWFHALTIPAGPRNAYLRAAQFSVAADPTRSLLLAQSIVIAKGKNQRTLLRRNAPENPELEAILLSMKNHLDIVNKASNPQSLLGIEGAIARDYFSQFTTMLRPEAIATGFAFDTRNRRPPRDPINACLSYLYALLVKETTIALAAEGLDPWWGFFHQPRHGKPALALDLMEEFRPLVADSAVLTAINNGMVQQKHFVSTAAGTTLLPEGKRALIQAYENRLDQLATHPVFGYRASWRTLIRLQARLLGKWLRNDIPEYIGITTR